MTTSRFRYWSFGGLPALLLVASVASAQQAADIPRLANGLQDLQRTWDFRTITPLQRPVELGLRATLTPQEAAEFEAAQVELRNRDNFTDTSQTGDYNDFWYDRGKELDGDVRTSLIISPENGRVPELTDAAQARNAERRRLAALNEGIEVRPLSERCIMGFNSGPPMTPSAYNNNVQLVQTEDHFVIHNEMVHNARIVRMNDPEHRDAPRKWEGDSIGYWEGDTLIVETRNFAGATSFGNSSENMQLTEKFWRIDKDTIGYEFTVEDPATWTEPWTAMFTMVAAEQPIYEYACHEGNYSIAGIMAGWRTLEVQEELKSTP